ncbi:coiled-coil-helix-coiled-coil-helix domain-containing protein mitochondrial [Elysia marginata]|uniref:Coiled-coil-helix-coiled-coil-helix domain-containing protein mitochondrial n=1 Tax=Elysia marginata TaxID=1093978 RepID=A0AAV4HJP4_9GAST|nr:coiled-coil-helix-coiled-coil-helix domain-containing protein mitochondrial [Elysia marginata]
MPRGGGRRGGFGAASPSRSRSFSSTPKQRFVSPRAPPAGPSRPGWFKGGSSGIGGVIAGSFLGSALGTVLGNALSSRMYEGRDPDTGQWVDPGKEDKNPCKKELDYFLTCARYVDDLAMCKGASDALKQCAERNKEYFEE